MGTNNVMFLEVIEWFDESGKELVHRIPESGSGEIKWGAQLTVRESQAAVFFYNGKACDAFGPGRQFDFLLNRKNQALFYIGLSKLDELVKSKFSPPPAGGD